ncbi:NlpC/P60 family protein [Streptomyces sp. Ag109_O5-1]|uniref:C40 family peptidase n=1 Tax=Streptomyces sp. Ag109_O5-1 TaxID=1938851 RepID=UPI000F4FD9A3|nr:C40 family peptidase [Streptomyces sp. Ag109_O5-1]RPE40738.1 NlpC/P60 family protein [Streptomyces sp. Ag109_O5-1]
MSARFLRLACTAAVAAQAVLAPVPALAVPEPQRPVAELLTDLQQLYRQAEQATETYNATEERLQRQRAEVTRLDDELALARRSLHSSRAEAGRLARQQYQSTSGISPYIRLLLARDPQHALDEGHVIGELARERARTVGRLAGDERKQADLARKARKAFDTRLALADAEKKQRDEVRARLSEVERMLAALTPDQLTALAALEQNRTADAQRRLTTSGSLSATTPPPSQEGDRAVRYAVQQLGKPYEWGAAGPKTYDCSGLTSQAWDHAGTPIPRTSQEQWAALPHVPLNQLRPGDLVVYFPEATHVALYLGGGRVVQAPRPGAKIKVSPIAANPILGAVRPDPKARPLTRYTPPTVPKEATEGPDEGFNPSQPTAPTPT